MPKGNQASVRLERRRRAVAEQRRVQEQLLLLAAVARVYGHGAADHKELWIRQSDLTEPPAGEKITIKRALPDGSPGLFVAVAVPKPGVKNEPPQAGLDAVPASP